VYEDGFHGDCSKTYLVGEVDESGKKLVEATNACLMVGIGVCRDGEKVSVIGEAIEKEAKARGFQVIPAVAGHGIGCNFHEPPDIFHFGNTYKKICRRFLFDGYKRGRVNLRSKINSVWIH